MTWQSNPYVLPMMLSAVASLTTASLAWRRKSSPGAVPLAAIMLAAFLWSAAYALETGFSDLSTKLIFTGMEYVAIVCLPLAWLALALEYAGIGISSRSYHLLAVIPAVTVALVWTNGHHGLIYAEVWIDPSGGYPAMGMARGPWYWVNVAYSYLVCTAATLIVLQTFFRLPRIYKHQSILLLTGALVPLAANLAYLLGFQPLPYLDLTPAFFTVSGMVAALALFRFDFLNLAPMARDAVIEDMAEGLMVLDQGGKVLDMNPAARRILGIRPGMGVGRVVDEFPVLAREVERLEREGGSVEVYFDRGMTEEGRGRYYQLSLSPVYGRYREVRGRLLLIQDVTSRNVVEVALRDSEETALALLNATLDAAYLVDGDGTVLALSEAGAKNFGVTVDEMRDTCVFDYHPPDLAERRRVRIEHVFTSGEPVRFQDERDGRHFDNSIYPVFDEAGMVKRVAIFARDITDRKRAEEEMERINQQLEERVADRTAELEARNAEMERFIYTVSHDLRNPLVTAAGFLGLLRGDLGKGDLERAEEDIRSIEEAVTRMDLLLGETLELSRIGRVANPPADVSFREMAEEALEQTADGLRGVEVYLDDDLPSVRVDRTRIVEALVNLLENCAKYMGSREGAKIRIGYGLVAGEPVFFVRDNGAGMDSKQVEKVLDLFYKADLTSEGSGVGLAIVKRIVEVHGGRIWIESEKGEGFAVYFTLPLAEGCTC